MDVQVDIYSWDLLLWSLFRANLSTCELNTLNYHLYDVMTFLDAIIHSPLWGECFEFMMPQLSWLM
jgi:hypothetical protein